MISINDIDILQIKSLEDIKRIADLMQKIWDLNDREVVSTLEMKAISRFGDIIGAFYKEDIIGFIYAFPVNCERYYSHMMGVAPDFQSLGVGWALKNFHRKVALKKGVKVIEWTVDPLLPNNAYLNFHKLGVSCKTYFIDYYGNTENNVGIYSGIPTDRFLVEWWLEDSNVIDKMTKVEKSLADEKAILKRHADILPISEKNGVIIPKIKMNQNIELQDFSYIKIQIPSDFQFLRKNHTNIAYLWRINFRQICTYLFNAGFLAYDFISIIDNHSKRNNYYLFKKIINDQ